MNVPLHVSTRDHRFFFPEKESDTARETDICRDRAVFDRLGNDFTLRWWWA